MKKLLILLLIISSLSYRTLAQIFAGPTHFYQLNNGSSGADKTLYIPNGEGQLIVRPNEPEQNIFRPAQVTYFNKNGYRFEPVFDFSVPLHNRKDFRIAQDFAIVLDTGRITILRHVLFYSKNSISYVTNSYLLRIRNEQKLLVIPDTNGKFSNGPFDVKTQRILLRIFADDPEVTQLLTQEKLTSLTLPEYIRAYNKLH